jgi:iron(III) transport system ATP-binding protein
VTQQLCLELRHIRKEFGAFAALQDINLGVRQGEFVCFLGPSGCGKTTLLRIVGGLVKPSGGEITIDGDSVPAALRALHDPF